jgi:hypothetical protein
MSRLSLADWYPWTLDKKDIDRLVALPEVLLRRGNELRRFKNNAIKSSTTPISVPSPGLRP